MRDDPTRGREPSMEEVHQVEAEVYEPREVPVRVEGDVNVRSLPGVAWNTNRFQLSDTVGPVRATGRNPFRKRLLLIAETSGFLFGASDEQVRTRNNAGFVPLTTVIELQHTEEVWINNNAGESPKATIIEEMWTN